MSSSVVFRKTGSVILITASRRRESAKRFAFAALVFGSATFGTPLSAQNDATERLSDPRARASIQRVLKLTSEKHLPIDPLVRKVREGVTKKSDPALIEAAVVQMAKRLETSSSALAPVFSADELSAGADALQVGVPEKTLREFRKMWSNRPLTVPLGVLHELVSRQVSVSRATKRVRDLMMNGATDRQLASMSAFVVADVEAGLAPNSSLELRTNGVMSILRTSGGVSATVGAPTVTTPSTPPPKPPIRPK